MKYTDEEISAWLAHELDENTSAGIAKWVETSTAAQQRVAELRLLEQAFSGSLTYEPPAEMLYEFREKIVAERDQSTRQFRWYQAAAAIVLMIAGFGAGRVTLDTGRPVAEFGELKQEVQVLQQLVMMNTLQDHTASERLQAINLIEASPAAPDEGLVNTLVQSMNNDGSPNVRFAAVQALGRFIDTESVRAQMVRSLGDQDDPLVQIALINLLMQAGEKAAIAPLSKIAANENVPVEVRRTAELALDILI